MNTVKPHIFIRLVDAMFERVFKTAVAAGPVLGGLAVGMLDSSGQSVDRSTTNDEEFPEFSDVTNLNWEATYGHSNKR